MTPDQKPPPRTDMSAITTEEFSNQILCSHINGDAYVWNHNCQVIQAAINQSTAAMRDELERVNASARHAKYMADTAAELAEIGRRWREDSSLEKWFPWTAKELPALQQKLQIAEETLADQSAKMAALEAQAGAMREALMYTNNTLVVQNYPACRCGANTACDEPHRSDCVTIAAMDKAKSALSTQAGNDLLRELTAMRGAMTERNTLAERTTDALLKRVQALEAALKKCRDMAGIYMDCAGHHSDGDDPCPKCELAKAITAALSQEQATTRNG